MSLPAAAAAVRKCKRACSVPGSATVSVERGAGCDSGFACARGCPSAPPRSCAVSQSRSCAVSGIPSDASNSAAWSRGKATAPGNIAGTAVPPPPNAAISSASAEGETTAAAPAVVGTGGSAAAANCVCGASMPGSGAAFPPSHATASSPGFLPVASVTSESATPSASPGSPPNKPPPASFAAGAIWSPVIARYAQDTTGMCCNGFTMSTRSPNEKPSPPHAPVGAPTAEADRCPEGGSGGRPCATVSICRSICRIIKQTTRQFAPSRPTGLAHQVACARELRRPGAAGFAALPRCCTLRESVAFSPCDSSTAPRASLIPAWSHPNPFC